MFLQVVIELGNCCEEGNLKLSVSAWWSSWDELGLAADVFVGTG